MSEEPLSPAPTGRAGDDEATVVGGSMNGGSALPLGHALQEYVIDGLIGEGGFGIVYLARDTRLGRNVALKEYMPANLAARNRDFTVSVRSERHRDTFELGLRSFVNEAQLLASFDHPSLVKVYRFWEANGTAYMVMPFYQGPTLKKWLADRGSEPDERWLRALLAPMIDALELLHQDHCYHRDIAPDNILLLTAQGAVADTEATHVRPVLLDFGAARRVIGDMTHALTVILKPGYAPIEQYAESAAMKQGPWTDVYALSAVLYACVTGRAPAPSVSRIINDDMVSAVEAGAGRYTSEFLRAIDAGLAVRPEQRPQSMAAVRALFVAAAQGGHALQPAGGSLHAAASAPVVPVALPASAPAARTAPVTASTDDAEKTVIGRSPGVGRREASPAAPSASRQPATKPAWWVGGLAALLLLAGGGAWWWLGGGGRPAPSGPVAMKSDAPPPMAAPPMPATPAAANPPVAAPATPEPFTVLAALQDIVARGDPSLSVSAQSDKPVVSIGKDALKFRVRSSQSGYLYLYSGGTDKSHFWVLFPNQLDGRNRIEAGRELVLPRDSWKIVSDGPAGTNHIVALVSRHERKQADPGLLRSGEVIPEFDLAISAQRWAQRPTQPGGLSPFIGVARCPAPPCDEGYGAAMFEITEVAGPAARTR